MIRSCFQQHLNNSSRSAPDLQNFRTSENLSRSQGTENVGEEIQRPIVPVVACVTSSLVTEVIDRAAGQRLFHEPTVRILDRVLQRTPRQRKDRNPERRTKIRGRSHVDPEHYPKQRIKQRAIDFVLTG